MEQVESHLQQFKEWMKKSTDLGHTSVQNYYTTTKGFYNNSGRQKPLNFKDLSDEKLEHIAEDIANHITSRSMKFGMRKYLQWLSLQTTDFEADRTIQFMREKTNRLEFEQSKEDVESKVIGADTLAQVCRDAGRIDDELGLMLRMMYETGARFSGMNRLLWRDVERAEFSGEHLKPHQVFISKDRSKGKVDGVVEISDRTLNELEQLKHDREEVDSDDQVFFSDMTNASTYQKAWRFFDSNWTEYSTHFFRHSRLTHLGLQMYEVEDLDYPTIKERLRRYGRHKDSSTTEIYIEIVKNKLAQKNQDMEQYRSVDWSKA